MEQSHVPDFKNAKVLSREEDETKRRIKESIWIKKLPTINRDQGAIPLSNIYCDLMPLIPIKGGGGRGASDHPILSKHFTSKHLPVLPPAGIVECSSPDDGHGFMVESLDTITAFRSNKVRKLYHQSLLSHFRCMQMQ